MKPKVFVTRKIPSPGIELLKESCEVDVFPHERPPFKNEILEKIKDKDAILCLLTDRIDKEVLDSSQNLKIVSSFSVGVDHIDVEEATRRGIYVTYTPGVLTEATADFTWALLLAITRRLIEADKFVRSKSWKIQWSPTMLLGSDVYGKTIGIIGFGRIGLAVAKRAKGFSMKILYFDINRATPDLEKELNAEFCSLERLLKESDFITLHVSLNESTYHMIGENELKLMKPTAFLINTSRGAVIDERALKKALKEKWISGAALDVFEKEPIDENDPLLYMDNVVLAPHTASATHEARSKMAEVSAKNLLAVLKGNMPLFLVNPEVLNIRKLSEVKML
ncbi:MAG: glyoxylate reductase [Candidatus Bathyarchaeia archaeon]